VAASDLPPVQWEQAERIGGRREPPDKNERGGLEQPARMITSILSMNNLDPD